MNDVIKVRQEMYGTNYSILPCSVVYGRKHGLSKQVKAVVSLRKFNDHKLLFRNGRLLFGHYYNDS